MIDVQCRIGDSEARPGELTIESEPVPPTLAGQITHTIRPWFIDTHATLAEIREWALGGGTVWPVAAELADGTTLTGTAYVNRPSYRNDPVMSEPRPVSLTLTGAGPLSESDARSEGP